MLSLELSTIQAKDQERAAIREAMASYDGPINVIPSNLKPVNTSRFMLPGSPTDSPHLRMVARLRDLAAKGARVTAIAKELRIGRQTVRQLARDNGIVIQMADPTPALKVMHEQLADKNARKHADLMAGITELEAQGKTRQQIAERLGVSLSSVARAKRKARDEK